MVASDVGGHHELIRDKETGYLFRAGDRASLAQTVLDALADQSRWEEIRRAGRLYVEGERNWRKSVEGYIAIYTALTSAF